MIMIRIERGAEACGVARFNDPHGRIIHRAVARDPALRQ